MSFLNTLLIPLLITVATFVGFGIKKYIEKLAELHAEEWYKKRKEK